MFVRRQKRASKVPSEFVRVDFLPLSHKTVPNFTRFLFKKEVTSAQSIVAEG